MSQAEFLETNFLRYPSTGSEDWEYAFEASRVRVLETAMIDKSTFVDMANAESFEAALEMLTGTEYAISGVSSFEEIENMLLERRSEARRTSVELMRKDEFAELLRAREDFANMRLAVRRVVTERPIGRDYSNDGSVPASEFEEIFEQEDYSRFPEYLQNGVEAAVLAYYEDKDIRQIDYAIDRVEFEYRLKKAKELSSVFLRSLFKMQIDLNNIRTMLRLKMAERDERQHFIKGGFLPTKRFEHGLDLGYEGLAPLFFATPYNEIIETGVNYLNSEKSFLGLEMICESYMKGFLRSTKTIAAGPQPVIAYLLLKEIEIRTVRMVLSCKKNGLDAKPILDRISDN